ncbi:hypothetical protein [Sporichthya polymorpha]|uniref:hypothetical protein n=1 Tax=Sporichthya polymorpha TaxID=35751 RepID=UPI00037176A2|nr:hypothetical protein [Sporichthya polymorpha]
MQPTDAVHQAHARLTDLLERNGAELPSRVVALLSSAADHLLDSTALPEPVEPRHPLDPRTELADMVASLRDVLPLVGDRAAIAIGFALRDLSAAEAVWGRS